MPPDSFSDLVHAAWIAATETVASVVPQAATARVGGWFVYDAGVDNSEFNLATPEPGPAGRSCHPGDARSWFAAREAGFGFRLRTAADAEVIARLGHSQPAVTQPYLALPAPADAPAPPGACLARVADDRGVQDFESFDAGRGHPPEHSIAAATARLRRCALWVAHLNGVPVARAMSINAEPIATIHNVVVAPEYRRRGLGAWVTSAAARHAFECGATTVALASSPMALSLYRRLGFEPVFDLATYDSGLGTWDSGLGTQIVSPPSP